MTRKHFEKLAAIILANKECGGDVHDLVERLVWLLEDINPRFDRVRFMKACGEWED